MVLPIRNLRLCWREQEYHVQGSLVHNTRITTAAVLAFDALHNQQRKIFIERDVLLRTEDFVRIDHQAFANPIESVDIFETDSIKQAIEKFEVGGLSCSNQMLHIAGNNVMSFLAESRPLISGAGPVMGMHRPISISACHLFVARLG